MLQQSSSIACHSPLELRGPSLGHWSSSYCILRSGKTFRPRPCAPSTLLRRGASSFARDCTQPVDGTANPLRANAEYCALQPPSPSYPQPYFFFVRVETAFMPQTFFSLLA